VKTNRIGVTSCYAEALTFYLQAAECDLGQITNKEVKAKAGRIMQDNTNGACMMADATIAAAHRMAFPIKGFLFITQSIQSLACRQKKTLPHGLMHRVFGACFARNVLAKNDKANTAPAND
jgi:hypothetical protein